MCSSHDRGGRVDAAVRPPFMAVLERPAMRAFVMDVEGPRFERDYRAQLRGYIEGKLRDLETTGTTSGSTPVSAIGL